VKAFKPAQLSTPILVVLHFQPSAAPRPNAAVAAHSCTSIQLPSLASITVSVHQRHRLSIPIYSSDKDALHTSSLNHPAHGAMGLCCYRLGSIGILCLPKIAISCRASRSFDLRHNLVFALHSLRRHLGYPHQL
jgi:hypothetical protein